MLEALNPSELGCPILCENVEYHIINQKLGQNVHFHENRTMFWAKFHSGSVKIEEEYTLMGTNAIISATGGSLGLFLGFSCYGAIWNIFEMFEAFFDSIFLSKRKKAKSGNGRMTK